MQHPELWGPGAAVLVSESGREAVHWGWTQAVLQEHWRNTYQTRDGGTAVSMVLLQII